MLKQEPLLNLGQKIAKDFRSKGINVSFDTVSSIGKRYAKNDEIGTPWCATIDPDSLADNCVTIRDRDTTKQERIAISDLYDWVSTKIV